MNPGGMDTLQISGKWYVSSRRAAKEYGYHTDYIGQLIRAGKIKGQKVGRSWYVSTDSLTDYLGSEKPASLKDTMMSDEVLSDKENSPAAETEHPEEHIEDGKEENEEQKNELVENAVAQPTEEKIKLIPADVHPSEESIAPTIIKEEKITETSTLAASPNSVIKLMTYMTDTDGHSLPQIIKKMPSASEVGTMQEEHQVAVHKSTAYGEIPKQAKEGIAIKQEIPVTKKVRPRKLPKRLFIFLGIIVFFLTLVLSVLINSTFVVIF